MGKHAILRGNKIIVNNKVIKLNTTQNKNFKSPLKNPGRMEVELVNKDKSGNTSNKEADDINTNDDANFVSIEKINDRKGETPKRQYSPNDHNIIKSSKLNFIQQSSKKKKTVDISSWVKNIPAVNLESADQNKETFLNQTKGKDMNMESHCHQQNPEHRRTESI